MNDVKIIIKATWIKVNNSKAKQYIYMTVFEN